jgi:hypothetical protein
VIDGGGTASFLGAWDDGKTTANSVMRDWSVLTSMDTHDTAAVSSAETRDTGLVSSLDTHATGVEGGSAILDSAAGRVIVCRMTLDQAIATGKVLCDEEADSRTVTPLPL